MTFFVTKKQSGHTMITSAAHEVVIYSFDAFNVSRKAIEKIGGVAENRAYGVVTYERAAEILWRDDACLAYIEGYRLAYADRLEKYPEITPPCSNQLDAPFTFGAHRKQLENLRTPVPLPTPVKMISELQAHIQFKKGNIK